MAGSQISTSVTIIDSLSGFMALSLTEYNTSAACSIAAGSKVEIAGAFFTFAGDEAIEASTWTSIVTGNTAYIALTTAGSAGSQTVTARYTNVAPTWRDDLQGWYASAASNVRVIGSVYKAEAANYANKYLYNSMQDQKQRSISVLNASVASSLSVAGDGIVSGAFTVSGKTILSGVTRNNYLYADGMTWASVNTALLPVTPASGDSVVINGSIYIGAITTTLNIIYAIREDATSMSLYGRFTASSANTTRTLTSLFNGNNVAISW